MLTTIFTAVLFVWSADSSVCNIDSSLYEKRKVLVDEYARTIGNEYIKEKETADSIIGRLITIDQKYYDAMIYLSDAAISHHYDQIKLCCSDAEKDPFMFQICQIAKFKTSRQETGTKESDFVARFPATTEDINNLWILDEIAFLHHKRKGELPSIFKPNGPTFVYIDNLFRLVATGNKKALKKYFRLLKHSDGEYSEYIVMQIESLFKKNPELILNNWNIVKTYKHYLQFSELLPTSDVKSIKDGFDAVCKGKNVNCDEIKAMFK